MMLAPKMVALALVGTLAFLALAIFAEGGVAAFFAHTPLGVVAIATVAMTAVSLFTAGNLSAGLREDRSNRWVLAAFGVIGLLGAFVPALTDRADLWTIDGETTRWIGVVLFIAGGVLRIWPVFVLGKRFSGLVAIQPGHTLVTGGLYRVIRHPSYLGLVVNSLGWGLAFRSGVGVALTALTLIPLSARIRSEEALLQSEFGAEYDAFRARTWRLLPGLY